MDIFNNRIWSTWTSLCFLVPAYSAYMHRMNILCILLVLQTFFSTLYHLDKPAGPDWWWRRKHIDQHLLQIVDTILALFISFHVLEGIYGLPFGFHVAMVIALGTLSLFFFFVCRKKYEAYHGLWHITASLTVLVWLVG